MRLAVKVEPCVLRMFHARSRWPVATAVFPCSEDSELVAQSAGVLHAVLIQNIN